jgi:hypothetical protein
VPPLASTLRSSGRRASIKVEVRQRVWSEARRELRPEAQSNAGEELRFSEPPLPGGALNKLNGGQIESPVHLPAAPMPSSDRHTLHANKEPQLDVARFEVRAEGALELTFST